ncbi:MAG TPA: MarR family transcriptional regulator [Gaiellaceae bacterium]|nr:MarR family transcriptional regulator [Gaiellaceae bacterium]
MATKSETKDGVDRLLAEWATELHGVDLEVEAAVQRLQKITRAIRRRMDDTLADFGLSWGEWGILGHLSLLGTPYRSSPGQLSSKEGVSSGAMTNRLDRLEKAGLIQRLPDPADRRALKVELTEKGHKLWQDSVGVQASKEAAIRAALSERELAQLNKLLRKVVLELEKDA